MFGICVRTGKWPLSPCTDTSHRDRAGMLASPNVATYALDSHSAGWGESFESLMHADAHVMLYRGVDRRMSHSRMEVDQRMSHELWNE